MRMPVRIQRMPEHTKYVGRGSLYGNPYRVARSRRELDAGDPMVVATPEEAVERFREWLHTPQGRLVGEACQRLWGLDLACWCPMGQPCHADVLLEEANPRGAGELENPYYRIWDRGPEQLALITKEDAQ